MKKKRFLSGMVMFCLLASNICVPVAGAEKDSKGLEKAIISTKKVITIPESYSEFTHYSNEVEKNGTKSTVWRLNWSEKEGNYGFISASVDESGNLYEYSKFSGGEYKTGLADVTKSEAQNIAEKFLTKVIPIDSGELKIVDGNQNDFQSDTYNFMYEQFVNGIPINLNDINIGINKYTGEVTNFNESNSGTSQFEYQKPENIIDIATAEKNYIDKIGIDLKYYSNYDYNNKKINIFAAYSQDDNNHKAIDGKTGEVIKVYSPNNIIYNMYSDKAGSLPQMSNAMEKLTVEEQSAVNNVDGLITKEKAEGIVRDSLSIPESEMKVSDVSLSKDDFNNKYVWQIGFENGNGQVDAKTSELISIHLYNYYNDGNNTTNVSKSQAQTTAEEFLKKVAPDKFSQTKYKDIENTMVPMEKISVIAEGNVYYFNYIRQVNGIEFDSNYLRIEVNKNTGKVVGYDNNWYENVTFPSIDGVIGKEAAFNKFKEYKNFALQYDLTNDYKVKLTYNFKDTNNFYIIDPFSGVRLDYSGQAYKEIKQSEYTDIKGHWSEKIVKELLDNGYYIQGDKFNPDKTITQINLFKFIYPSFGSNNEEDFYNMLIQNKIITKEEKNPNASVSNKDAAKYIIKYLGYEKVAIHSEVFINPFKDTIEEKYKGYAAMCYALGINKGDKNGNFNQDHNLTNAESAVLIYNLIKNNSR